MMPNATKSELEIQSKKAREEIFMLCKAKKEGIEALKAKKKMNA